MATPVEERKQPADRATARRPAHEFDAIVLVSFGGPEGPDDVLPFLENVTRGRNVPRERLLDVAHHYELFGGVSPINAQNRELIAALEPELRRAVIDLPVYFGNRNWHPYLTDTMQQMTDDGVGRALAVFTSAFSSYSGCRQYREDLFNAQQAVGPAAPEVPRARMFFNHPGFIEANVDRVRAALSELRRGRRPHRVHRALDPLRHGGATAPTRRSCERRRDSSRRRSASPTGRSSTRAAAARRRCRGSGRTSATTCETCTSGASRAVVISPIGFVSDHLEVRFDLDVEAREIADELGLPMARAGTAGTHPAVRRGPRRPDRRADDAGRGAAGARPVRAEPRCLRRRLLPAGHRPAEPLGRGLGTRAAIRTSVIAAQASAEAVSTSARIRIGMTMTSLSAALRPT